MGGLNDCCLIIKLQKLVYIRSLFFTNHNILFVLKYDNVYVSGMLLG